MKKKKTKPDNSARKFPRSSLMIVAAIAVVSTAAITVLSRQSANSKQVQAQEVTSAMTNPADKKYVKVKVGGQDVYVDSQTGKIKPLTPQEAQDLAEGLKGMLNKSSEGLVEVHNDDGSVSMDLQDRFQNVTVARENEDGSVSTSCVDNPQAAASFFGIDRKLLEKGPQPPKTAEPTPNND